MTSRRVVLGRSAALIGAASTGLLLPQIVRAQSNKIRVGLMLPYTGTFAALGVNIEAGFRMAVEELETFAPYRFQLPGGAQDYDGYDLPVQALIHTRRCRRTLS